MLGCAPPRALPVRMFGLRKSSGTSEKESDRCYMSINSLSQDIRSIASAAGADMIGFAPVGRFDTGPEQTHPNYFMARAHSVVVIGIGFPRSIGEVWGTFADEGCLPTPYMWFGFAYLNWELSRVALKVAKALESRGYRSLPLPPHTRLPSTATASTSTTGAAWQVTSQLSTRLSPLGWGRSGGALCSSPRLMALGSA